MFSTPSAVTYRPAYQFPSLNIKNCFACFEVKINSIIFPAGDERPCTPSENRHRWQQGQGEGSEGHHH